MSSDDFLSKLVDNVKDLLVIFDEIFAINFIIVINEYYRVMITCNLNMIKHDY